MTAYDNSEEIKFIIYLDTNNLYGWGMSQYFPYGEFEWLIHEEINNFDVYSLAKIALMYIY